MVLVFRISVSSLCDYNRLNSSSRSLLALMLISVLALSGIFTFLVVLNPKQVSAQDQEIVNNYEEIKYRLLPKMVMFDLPSKQMIEANRSLVGDDPFKQLLAQADYYLTKKPDSVMEKKQIPSSGDKHDFLSLSPYYWPDATKPNVLPYILYASKASELLRVWFLNSNTHMNPNLQHSELILGKNSGSHSGIIAGIYFPDLIDAIGLIQDSLFWTEHDQQGIELWFDKYLEWLLNSDFGKKESRTLNNHRTWFDVQVSSIALFLNKTEITRDILKNNIDKLIGAKIQRDGTQPFEIHRRTSLDYYIFDLLAFFNLAKIGDHIGFDLWDYKTRQGSGLQKGLDYLLPYALGKKTWPHEQIRPIDKGKLMDLLCQATIHYGGNETYKEAYKSIHRQNVTEKIDNLIYGCITA